MPVKDVNDVLINVFFFFYSGSFINIYYLISITFTVVPTVTGVSTLSRLSSLVRTPANMLESQHY
jgi:hypothetical protein